MKRVVIAVGILIFLLGVSCNTGSGAKAESPVTERKVVEVPAFNADSAYQYVAGQVAFGCRVPNTPAHVHTGAWLASELKRHGAEVVIQEALVKAYDGTTLNAKNIIGSYNPEKQDRIMLFAHWDTRPYADEEEDPSKHHTPIDGANDGASGVGVLLEIARQLGLQKPNVGVDIFFFDAEDYGVPEFYTGREIEDSWALGTQYWARRPHKPGYKARYGILLDMVGGKNATFGYESYSEQFALPVLKKVWDTAKELGYGNYFVSTRIGYITDDHVYVNTLARIPSIDILDYSPKNKNGFNDQWHTLNDNLDHIDPATLKAVGQTVLTVVYRE